MGKFVLTQMREAKGRREVSVFENRQLLLVVRLSESGRCAAVSHESLNLLMLCANQEVRVGPFGLTQVLFAKGRYKKVRLKNRTKGLEGVVLMNPPQERFCHGRRCGNFWSWRESPNAEVLAEIGRASCRERV